MTRHTSGMTLTKIDPKSATENSIFEQKMPAAQ